METRDSGLGIRGSGKKAGDRGLGTGGWGRKAGFWVLGAGYWALLGVLATTAASPRGIAKESAESNPSQELRIELHVYDYAGVEAREWARAQAEATKVLQKIGVAVTWANCVVPGTEATHAKACPSSDGQVPALVLHVLPRAMAERAGHGKGLLGFAQLSDDGAPADTAFVFYHRVESLAAELRCARGVILGYALAHEVGHLLLGTNSHAASGIMCARWTEKELRLASTGFFGFFPQQAAKMRADVLARRGASETAREGLLVSRGND